MRLLLVAATLFFAPAAYAQNPYEPSAQLRTVLPAKVAGHVSATIAKAHAQSLPATALEQHALRLARQGAMPGYVQRSVDRNARNMRVAKASLERSGRNPTSDEIVAGGALVGKGVNGNKVSAWAKSAPSGRDLTVPMNVAAGLIDRGLRSDVALARVHDRLVQRQSDRQLVADALGQSAAHLSDEQGGLSHCPATPAPGQSAPASRAANRGRNG